MPALLAVLLFSGVFVAVGCVVYWLIAALFLKRIERHFGVMITYVSAGSRTWNISGAKSRWQLWVIPAIHVFGMLLAIGVGAVAGFAVLFWALPVFRSA